ncbi:hypothetical protein L2E82_44832 [Cichorium intybus]|uniref:Uncharacterized protein n=1 Tax=Cichorium intybus TaxID=13427 RepID=A0ACB8ZSB0_CICIN|nr:hypothetical protein L2E82_44832 [Cichorium intybus]
MRFTIGAANDSKSVKNMGTKEVQNNGDKFQPGNLNFVFGSNLGNAFSGTPLSKVSHDAKTSNIHDPTKVGTSTNKINEAGTTNNFNFSSKVGREDPDGFSDCDYPTGVGVGAGAGSATDFPTGEMKQQQ